MSHEERKGWAFSLSLTLVGQSKAREHEVAADFAGRIERRTSMKLAILRCIANNGCLFVFYPNGVIQVKDSVDLGSLDCFRLRKTDGRNLVEFPKGTAVTFDNYAKVTQIRLPASFLKGKDMGQFSIMVVNPEGNDSVGVQPIEGGDQLTLKDLKSNIDSKLDVLTTAVKSASDKLAPAPSQGEPQGTVHGAVGGAAQTLNRALEDVTTQVGNVSNKLAPDAVGGRPQNTVTGAVGRAARTLEDALNNVTAYPMLTEEIGHSPTSPTSGRSGAGVGSALGQAATRAISDALGWKPRADDPKSFVGALNASFTFKELEGHTECVWTPRTYAVQTDLAGGISGAQASLYTRAKEAIDKSLELLDGLHPLRPDADEEYIEATREMVRNQCTQLVNELALPGGPRVSRVDQIFLLLLGPLTRGGGVEFDPDVVTGQLATLRRVLGLRRTALAAAGSVPLEPGALANTIEDEQDQTNFRIIVDYVTSLRQSWIMNRAFFTRTATQAFFGTQLVLLSRQLSVVAESVGEVRFALESVFIGYEEQQTLEINFPSTLNLQPMFVNDLLSWTYDYASKEGPEIIQQGGGFGVWQTLIPVLQDSLQPAVGALMTPSNVTPRTNGFGSPRVQNAIRELANQLLRLLTLAQQIPAPVF